MAEQSLKLRIELVPESCWYKSLRKQMPRSQWDKLRKRVLAEQGEACQICGAGGRLNCHETWEYDEVQGIQRLLGFQIVCGMCHHATHFGVSQILAAQGHLDLDAVIAHFMTVNGVSRREFENHRSEAFRVWRERSKRQWKTDLGEWASLAPPPPA